MSPLALLLGVVAMLAWGLAPLLDKTALQGVSPLAAVTVRAATAGIMVAAIALPLGVWRELATAPRHLVWYLVGGGILGSVIGQLAYYGALKLAPASQVVPFTAAYPLVAAVLAAVVLREGFTWPRVLGAALIVVGLVLVTGGKK